jgi:hypothetical protein
MKKAGRINTAILENRPVLEPAAALWRSSAVFPWVLATGLCFLAFIAYNAASATPKKNLPFRHL